MPIPSDSRQAGAENLSGVTFEAVSLKSVDYAKDQLRQLFERWDNRLKFEGLSISEGYLEGCLKFLADLDILSGGQTHRYSAVFDRAEMIFPEHQDHCIAPADLKVFDSSKVSDGYQEFVLVRNVEVVDGPEGYIASRVRFQRFENIDDIWAGTMYISLFDHRIKVVRDICKREVDVFDVPAVDTHKVTGQEIKRRAQIVDSIANEGGKIARHILTDPNGPSVLSGIGVLLDHDSIRITVEECTDFRVKIRDVAIGPFDL